MLQFLSNEIYNSPAVLVLFSLTPRELDKEYPLYIQPIIKDALWEIKATNYIVTGESRFKSFTMEYDYPIAYLRMGVFALRVILEDGSCHFKSFPDYYACLTQEELYLHRICDLNELIEETLRVLAEVKDDRMRELSQVDKRHEEYVKECQDLMDKRAVLTGDLYPKPNVVRHFY